MIKHLNSVKLKVPSDVADDLSVLNEILNPKSEGTDYFLNCVLTDLHIPQKTCHCWSHYTRSIAMLASLYGSDFLTV